MKTNGRPTQKGGGLNMGAAPTPNDMTQEALATLGGAAGMTRTQVGSYTTAIAVQVPRSLPAVEKEILYEAAQMGEDFIYCWRVKDKHSEEADGKTEISGMSIEGAMIMLRNWGNACCLPELIDENQTHYLFQATFIDLEKGFTSPRLFRQRKSAMKGGYEDDRKEDMAFQVGQSKAIRNSVDKAMPAWLKNKAIEASRSAAAKKYADVAVHVPKVVSYAKGLGVSEPQLVARVGKPLEAWTPYDIVYVRSVFRTIADKQSSIAEEFPPLTETSAKADAPSADTPADVVVTPDGQEVHGARESASSASTPAAPVKTADQLEAEAAEAALSAKEAASATMFDPQPKEPTT